MRKSKRSIKFVCQAPSTYPSTRSVTGILIGKFHQLYEDKSSQRPQNASHSNISVCLIWPTSSASALPQTLGSTIAVTDPVITHLIFPVETQATPIQSLSPTGPSSDTSFLLPATLPGCRHALSQGRRDTGSG